MATDSVDYVFKWANEADEKFIEDLLLVERTVFGGFDYELIKRKHIDNIYGPSLLAVAYLNGKPVGVDTMMRNDLFGRKAYETCDTCVLEECRGKGVFSTITKKEIEIIGPDIPIYGFPNHNSFPGYVKMGWDVRYKIYPAIFFSARRYNKEFPQIIDVEYAKWLSHASSDFRHMKIGNNYYLVTLTRRKHAKVVGRLGKETSCIFPRISRWRIINYSSRNKRFYNKDKYHGSLITYDKNAIDIPQWKSDGFIN
ncbi:MAG: hypothetical protein KBT00_02525 [Bacteroidales bacterium]|nr:hypothetical protein [Candidatus Cacconaster merdequi]